MDRHWTFGQKIVAGFAVMVVLTIVMGVVSAIALNTVVASKDEVITQDSPRLVLAERMYTLRERQGKTNRTYLLTGDPQDLTDLNAARNDFDAIIEELRAKRETDEGRQAVDAIVRAEAEHRQAIDQVIEMRKANADLPAIVGALNERVEPKRIAVTSAINDFITRETRSVNEARQQSSDIADTAINMIVSIAILSVLIAAAAAFYLARALNRQIGTAVSQVQSSAAELQAAANQQASGIKEQASSMAEITTTISELLATARQIAESAQRVSAIAEQTVSSAESGDGTVGAAHDFDRRHPPAGRRDRQSHADARQEVAGDRLGARHRLRACRADEHPVDQRDDRGGGRRGSRQAVRRRRRRDPQACRSRRRVRRRRFAC